MGMLDKARTKARTAPLVIRSPLPFEPNASWRLQSGIAAAALVRGAFAQVETRRLHSGTLRGRHGAIARFVNEQASCLWCVQGDDARSWRLELGMRSPATGYHIDWSIRVECREESGAVDVAIQTPAYLMRDKALVNGDSHDWLRDRLVAAFRGTDGAAGAAAEAEIVAKSLERTGILDEPVDFSGFGDCEIRTRLSDEDLAATLRLVSMPVVEAGATRRVFRLGLDRPDVPSSLGALSWDDERDEDIRTLRLSFALQPTGSTFLDAMAARGAANLAKRLWAYLADRDPEARWSRSDLYSWAW